MVTLTLDTDCDCVVNIAITNTANTHYCLAVLGAAGLVAVSALSSLCPQPPQLCSPPPITAAPPPQLPPPVLPGGTAWGRSYCHYHPLDGSGDGFVERIKLEAVDGCITLLCKI